MVKLKEKIINDGINDYLSKPIEPKELFKTLVKWLFNKEKNLKNKKFKEN